MDNQYKSLPGWTYTSEAFFELEKTELILKNWQLVCHISNIPETGDFFTFEIGVRVFHTSPNNEPLHTTTKQTNHTNKPTTQTNQPHTPTTRTKHTKHTH